ncbi:MAG: FecR family protein [Pseudomonadota bacterium]
MRKFGFLLAGLIMTMGSAHAQQIGVVASLEPSIDGTPPGQASRPLAVGVNVIANERIVSSPNGRGQLLFSDQTTLTIAPNSEVVLDTFVYDPDRDAGEIAVTLGKGALRFIGGRITKKTDGIIRTSNATIGVRGGIVLVELLAAGVRVILLAGEYVCVEGGTGRHCASRPGAILTEEGYQGVIGPEVLADLLRRLDGEDDPDPTQNRFSAGAESVGPAEKGSLSTTGEEREEIIVENDIRESIFDDRTIGRGAMGLEPEPVFDPEITPQLRPMGILVMEPTGCTAECQ